MENVVNVQGPRGLCECSSEGNDVESLWASINRSWNAALFPEDHRRWRSCDVPAPSRTHGGAGWLFTKYYYYYNYFYYCNYFYYYYFYYQDYYSYNNYYYYYDYYY